MFVNCFISLNKISSTQFGLYCHFSNFSFDENLRGRCKTKKMSKGWRSRFQSQTGQALVRWNTPEGGLKYYLFTQWPELLLLQLLIICVRQRMCLHCESKLFSTFMIFHFEHAYDIFFWTLRNWSVQNHYQYSDTPNVLGAFFVIYIVFIRPWSRKLTRLRLPSDRSVELPHSLKKDLFRLLQTLLK